MAIGLQGGKLALELVAQVTVGHTHTPTAQGRLVRHPPVAQTLARSQHTQAGQVAAARRVVQVHRRTDALFTRVAVACVVSVHAAADAGAGLDLDHQIRQTQARAGHQARSHLHTRHIRQQKQSLFQGRQRNRVPMVQTRQHRLWHLAVQAAGVVQCHLAVLAFQNRQGAHTIANLLRRQISACHQETMASVMLCDALGHHLQCGQTHLAPWLKSCHLKQIGFCKHCCTRHLQTLQRESRVRCAGRVWHPWLLDLDRFRTGRQIRCPGLGPCRAGGHLLHLSASAGQGLRPRHLCHQEQQTGRPMFFVHRDSFFYRGSGQSGTPDTACGARPGMSVRCNTKHTPCPRPAASAPSPARCTVGPASAFWSFAYALHRLPF